MSAALHNQCHQDLVFRRPCIACCLPLVSQFPVAYLSDCSMHRPNTLHQHDIGLMHMAHVSCMALAIHAGRDALVLQLTKSTKRRGSSLTCTLFNLLNIFVF
eukprot:jgi/Chrzof1/6869/Cz02g01160.t1